MIWCLAVSGLTKTYGEGEDDTTVHALRDVTLGIERGDFVAVMGTSGSGKSTLMNILGCLDVPTSGRYVLDGVDVSTLDETDLAVVRNTRIGFVFQSFNLLPRTSAVRNVELPLVYAGVKSRDRRRRALEALEAVGLGNRVDHESSQLSGGQQQRVAIARAMVTDAPLMLADEPTGNLDSASTAEILGLLEEQSSRGSTIVLITHEDEVAARARARDRAARRRGHRRPSQRRHRRRVGRVIESTRIALRGIAANRMRSTLTMLGILIGVAAVILLVAVGSGSSAAVREQIEGLGTNTLTVLRTPTQFGGGGTQSRRIELTEQDIEDLSNPDLAPSIEQVAYTENASGNVTWEGTSVSPDQIIGTTANYPGVNNWEMATGSFFSESDVEGHAKVAVIGSSVATDLFGTSDPLGQEIKINGVTFDVVGVLAAKGSNGFQDQDSVVMAPVSAVEDSLIGRNADIANVTVQARSSDVMDEAQAEIESILNTNHGVTADESPFSVLNQATLLDTSTETNRVFTVLLGAVAGISLLVGGIGVMNIMLVTVTERTREIGIRKAVGARRYHVLSQFLVEAVLLTMLGGVLGVLAGVAASRFEIAGVQPVVEPYSIVLSFGVAVAIGLFFGIYPANRAATLRPIDALRYE